MTFALYWLLRSTELGRQICAAASDREGGRQLMGINVTRVNLIAFGIGIGTLGIAGPVMLPIFYIVPNIGSFFILIAFVVVVLGGIGNFMGALIASFVVAITESLGALFMPGSTAPVLPFLLFILVLLFKAGRLIPGLSRNESRSQLVFRADRYCASHRAPKGLARSFRPHCHSNPAVCLP